MESEYIRLGDVVSKSHGGVSLKTFDYTNEGTPVLTKGDVKPYGRVVHGGKFVNPRHAVEKGWRHTRSGELIVTTRDLTIEANFLGLIGKIPSNQSFVVNQGASVLSIDTRRIDIDYLIYWSSGNEYRHYIKNNHVGSTQIHLRQGDLFNAPIFLPSMARQKFIAHILSTLDDKIELNRQVNATLEGMAQALFKSWFVDFDPVIDNAQAAGNLIPDELAQRATVRRKAITHKADNHQITRIFPDSFNYDSEMGWVPDSWEVSKLSELLEVKYGKDHKKLADGEVPVYGSGGVMRHADSSLFIGESVLIPRKGTLNNILYLNEEFWTVDTMFYTIPKKGSVAKFCYYYLKGLDFTSMNVGSAVPSMTTKILNDLPVISATQCVIERFDEQVSSYFRKIDQNNRESQVLAKIRNTLLPKLISGELCARDIEVLGGVLES